MSYIQELVSHLESKGFVNDQGWETENQGSNFYSLKRGFLRVEIRENFNKTSDFYKPIFIQILNCEKEHYVNSGYIGWIGRSILATFDKPIDFSLFENLIKHYDA